MKKFDHEKLDAYKISIEFIALSGGMVQRLPRGNSHLADQLKRASTSICLNIAEGAGEFSGSEKARFYRMAKRSATECAAILDVSRRLKLVMQSEYKEGYELLSRVVAMLTQMARVFEKTGSGPGPGPGRGQSGTK